LLDLRKIKSIGHIGAKPLEGIVDNCMKSLFEADVFLYLRLFWINIIHHLIMK